MSNRKSSKLKEHISRYSADIVLLVETDQWWKNEMDPVMSEYPYSVKVPLENTYGMLLYSKKPLNNTKVEYLIKKDVPSIHTEVEIDDCKISLSCLHPEPPAPTEADTSRPRDKELVVVAKKIKDLTLPCIALGDLNDVAWSDTSTQFTRISKMRDPRKGRGFFNTYNAKYPLLSWALDHVFLSNTFTVTELEKLSKIGSDHYPIYIKCGINKPD
ncbi:MAG: endonuclease/exonuclease/phosphatase family protein [Bacteroidota bacterium]